MFGFNFNQLSLVVHSIHCFLLIQEINVLLYCNIHVFDVSQCCDLQHFFGFHCLYTMFDVFYFGRQGRNVFGVSAFHILVYFFHFDGIKFLVLDCYDVVFQVFQHVFNVFDLHFDTGFWVPTACICIIRLFLCSYGVYYQGNFIFQCNTF